MKPKSIYRRLIWRRFLPPAAVFLSAGGGIGAAIAEAIDASWMTGAAVGVVAAALIIWGVLDVAADLGF